MHPKISSLNEPQNQAVLTTEGPLLVLAGAGTGKTKVLTQRIIYILANQLAQPHEILAVTFTNKAAMEMKKRIGEILPDLVNYIWIGTFHAIASRILRKNAEIVGLRSDFTIIDDDDQTRLIKQILGDLNIDPKQFLPKNYLSKISRLKDTGNNFFESDDVNLPKLKEVFALYQQRLKFMNSADFGDLLIYNLEIFSKNSEVLQNYQNNFRYILVDEYQDTNDTQYKWLLKLSQLYSNICCVGDDDQSIYSWRGANIANILRFEKDFINANIIRLEQNYRSTSRILKVAHSVISNNKERHSKMLWSDLGEGEKIQLKAFYNDKEESLKVANMVKNFIAINNYNASKIAILVRAGYQTRQFEESFMQNSINYKVIGGTKFYERLEIRDAIAYLRLCANDSDNLAFLRIINVPKRGVGDSAIENFQKIASQNNISLFQAVITAINEGSIKGKAKENLTNFVTIIQKYQKLINDNLAKTCEELLNECGYIASWKNDNSLEAQGRVENIYEFIKSLVDFNNITEFLEYATLVENKDDKNIQDAVNIMTIHAAKGLEFDVVFLPGLEEGIFPSNKSVEERKGIEEERRLMYVAITRAKKKLIMSYAKSRYLFGDVQSSLPSRFIKELPESEIEFEEGGFGGEIKYNNYFNSENKNLKYRSFNNFNDNKSSSKIDNNKLINNLYSFAIKNEIKTPKTPDVDNFFGSKSNHINPIGKRVFHQKFGYGIVENIDNNKYTISFDKSGIKTVIKDFITFS